jgi:pyruvate-ferredoxin/flavodoxin oxidoreductase
MGVDHLRGVVDDKFVRQHRERAMSSDRPILRGTTQNPDAFFQAPEACNPFYRACPTIVQDVMDRFVKQTGRQYRLFDYYGPADGRAPRDPDGVRCRRRGRSRGRSAEVRRKSGLVEGAIVPAICRRSVLCAIPSSVKSIAVLDRAKEPGSLGEPLYQEVLTGYMERLASNAATGIPRIIGGRYGLSLRESTPTMSRRSSTN